MIRTGLVFVIVLGSCRGTETVAPDLGTLRVEVTMTGIDIDRDGVIIAVDSAAPVAIPANGSYEFTNLLVGAHEVRLEGVTPNCASTTPFDRTALVTAAAAASVQFALACTKAPLAASGIIAFARADSDHTFDLWVMNPDGTGETEVRESPNISDMLPSWTPDGQRIVFVAAVGGASKILAFDRVGAVFTELTSDNPPTYTPSVSPDGRLIAYSQQKSGTDYDIWVMNADGTNRRQLTSDTAYEDQPAWSLDGTEIAFVRAGGIYRMNAEGANVQRLSPPSAENDGAPAWSPDGGLIAFHRTLNEPSHIYTMRPDGTQVTQLTTGLDNDYGPSWSADGARIAFASGRGSGLAIWSMRSDGTDLRRLSTGPDDFQPAWSR